jgi:AraC family transcriptional regulator of adaptative response / DNA-3-methyladenine glycosylase II
VADGGLLLRMPFTQPYDWAAMVGFLARNAVPGVESVDDGVYRRTIALDGHPGLLEIGPGGNDHLLLRAHLPYWEGVIHVVERAGRLVGLETEPVLAAAQLAGDPVIGPLIEARPGLRVPGAWGPFEVAVQAVVTAALNHEAAKEVLRRLVERCGTPVPGLGHGLTHAFPSAELLARAEQYGVPEEVAETVRALAEKVVSGNVVLDGGEALDELTGGLTSVPGLEQKTAHRIARRLGARDAFPDEENKGSEAWRPWRALAATHLETAAILG